MMKGYVHSTESYGTVDGPGLRYVIFLQGCPMRCQYCHNPDTWNMAKGSLMTAEDVLKSFFSNRAFYNSGGVTVTGGEPLMQIDYAISIFKLLKEYEVHTCIDTSGINFQPENKAYMQKLDALMNLTDLVMLDIKHINPDEHLKLTGYSNAPVLAFAKYLEQKKIPVWIRHVVVPGITFNEEYLYQLGYAIGALTNLKALDILPYHSLGNSKYEQLGISYPLKNTDDLSREDAIKAKSIILSGIKQRRAGKD